MSLFLGPIHYWLYKKINIQNDITNEILKKFEDENLENYLNKNYGQLEKGNLENLIDTDNIHSWLQEKVNLVEIRLAYLVTNILNKDNKNLEKLKTIFFEFGKNIEIDFDKEDATSIFKALEDILLDGMPCDRAKILLEKDSNFIKWQQNKCVHKDYWENVEGDILVYYILIDEFIKGFLTNTKFEYNKMDNICIISIKE